MKTLDMVKNKAGVFTAAFTLALMPALAFAEGEAAPMDFLAQVFAAIKAMGGLPWAGKVAAICLLLVASMKVSFIAPLWDKLGAAKVFVAPALALIGGLLSMDVITLPGAMAYIMAGAGAIAMHQILDAIKAIPGLGAMYVAVIDLISGLLRKP